MPRWRSSLLGILLATHLIFSLNASSLCSDGFPACALALVVLANFLSGIQTKCLLAHIFPLFKSVSRGIFAVSQTVRLRLRTAWREVPLHDHHTGRSRFSATLLGSASRQRLPHAPQRFSQRFSPPPLVYRNPSRQNDKNMPRKPDILSVLARWIQISPPSLARA